MQGDRSIEALSSEKTVVTRVHGTQRRVMKK